MLTSTRVFGALTLLSILACGGSDTKTEKPATETPPAETPPAAATVEAGKISTLDYPAVATTAVAGQFVLTPSREFLDKANTDGADKATFIYYGANMVTPGPVESTVKSLAGTEFSIPNSLIVAIPAGYQAKVGDVVLTQWESGSGLERAIVTGGTPTAPVVRYLDMDWDNPSGIGQKDDTLKPDHFTPVVRGAVGSTVACKKDGSFAHGVLVGLEGGKALHLGFAGRLTAYNTSDCVALDPKPTVAAGAAVQIPYIGSYTPGTVSKVDATNGRVWTKITFGGQAKEVAASWADTALALDALGQGFGGAPVVAGAPPAEPVKTATPRNLVPDNRPDNSTSFEEARARRDANVAAGKGGDNDNSVKKGDGKKGDGKKGDGKKGDGKKKDDAGKNR